MKKHSQPCWTCKKALGGCCWSKNYKPIKNWVAKKRWLSCGSKLDITYQIQSCPEYEFEPYTRCMTVDEIAAQCGISKRTVWRKILSGEIKSKDYKKTVKEREPDYEATTYF